MVSHKPKSSAGNKNKKNQQSKLHGSYYDKFALISFLHNFLTAYASGHYKAGENGNLTGQTDSNPTRMN